MMTLTYGLKRITAPAAEPVTLEQARAFLKFDADLTSEDGIIDLFRVAAIQNAESFTNRKFITQEWEMTLDTFPMCGGIELPFGCLQEVTEVKYQDASGVHILPAEQYVVDKNQLKGKISSVDSMYFPKALYIPNSVTVTFKCGYGDAADDVPQEIRVAILMATRLWYDNRASGDLPQTSQALLWPHRLLTL